MAYAITVLVSLLFTKDSQIILNFQHISRLSIPLKKKENVRNQKITSLKLRHQSDLKKILNFLKPYVYLFIFLFTDLLWKTNVEVSSLINYNCQRTGRQSYLIQFHNFEKLSISVTFSFQSIRLRLSYLIKIFSGSFSRSLEYAARKSNFVSKI